MGKYKKFKPVAACVICLGVILVIVGSVLLGAAPGQEVPMWWGVTICKTASGDWVGYPATSSCPAASCTSGGLCNSASGQAQTINIQPELITSTMNYSVALLRTENDVSINYDVVDSNGAILTNASGAVGQTSSTRRLLDLYSWPKDSESDDEDEADGDYDYESEDSDDNESSSISRHLLKGSSTSRGGGSTSGSSRSRSRSGTSFRWGSSSSSRSTSRRKTKYGYSGRRAVNSATVVVIYRSGPRNTKYTNNYADTTDHPNCADTKRGCEYTLPSDMVRDEFTSQPKIRPALYKPPYKIIIRNLTVKPVYTGPTRRLLAATDPELYFSLFSPDTIPGDATGGLLVGVGVAVLVLGCVFLVYVSKKEREDF